MSKKLRERSLLEACFCHISSEILLPDVKRDWSILDDARERPDFVVRWHGGAVYGVELTQLMSSVQGRDRHQDSRVARVIQEEVLAFVKDCGGRGGFVIASRESVPPPTDNLQTMRLALRAWLAAHRSEFLRPGGSVNTRCELEWIMLLCVSRADEFPGEVVISAQGPEVPEYSRGLPIDDLEEALVRVVAEKATQAPDFDKTHPLWLVIRNPNQRVVRLSAECQSELARANAKQFARVTLINMPFGVMDPMPPEPRYLDLPA